MVTIAMENIPLAIYEMKREGISVGPLFVHFAKLNNAKKEIHNFK